MQLLGRSLASVDVEVSSEDEILTKLLDGGGGGVLEPRFGYAAFLIIILAKPSQRRVFEDAQCHTNPAHSWTAIGDSFIPVSLATDFHIL